MGNKSSSVYVLIKEVSSQYGTTEVVGVFSTQQRAFNASCYINSRTYIRKTIMDELLPKFKDIIPERFKLL